MDEPRWLNEREERAWRGYRRMRDLLDLQINRDLAADSALSEADYTVLTVLSETPGHRMRLTEMAERVLWSKSRMSHQLTRMQKRGLIRREACDQPDRAATGTRGVDAVLTAEGLQTVQEAAPHHVASVRRHFFDALTEEQIEAIAEGSEEVVRRLRDRGH